MTTTTDLSKFGNRELHEVTKLINAMESQGLPEHFYDDEVTITFNTNSGCVFFTNSECQVAMMYGNDLEMFYSLPYSGEEGFADELRIDYENGNIMEYEDVEYLVDLGIVELDDEEEDFE